MTKEKAIELLVAVSQIEGYLIGKTGLERPAVVYNNLDILTKELVKITTGSETKDKLDKLDKLFTSSFVPGIQHEFKYNIQTKA